MAEISISIDPTQARQGAQQVRAALEGIQRSVRDLEQGSLTAFRTSTRQQIQEANRLARERMQAARLAAQAETRLSIERAQAARVAAQQEAQQARISSQARMQAARLAAQTEMQAARLAARVQIQETRSSTQERLQAVRIASQAQMQEARLAAQVQKQEAMLATRVQIEEARRAEREQVRAAREAAQAQRAALRETARVAREAAREAAMAQREALRRFPPLPTQTPYLPYAQRIGRPSVFPRTPSVTQPLLPAMATSQQIQALLRPTNTLTAAVGRFTTQATQGFVRWGQSIQQVRPSLLNLRNIIATLGVIALTRDLFKTGVTLESFHNSLASVLKSSELAKREFDFLKSSAEQFGFSLFEVLQPMQGFLAAGVNQGLTINQINEGFLALNKAMIVLGKDSETTARLMLAFEQVLNRGKLAAQELNLQMSNALPGSQSLAAEALKKTTAELVDLMEKGLIPANEFFLRMTETLSKNFPLTEKHLSSARVAVAKWQVAILDLKRAALDSGLFEAMTDAVRTLTDAIRDPSVVQAARELAQEFGTYLKTAAKTGAESLKFLADNLWLLRAAIVAMISTSILTGLGALIGLLANLKKLAPGVMNASGALRKIGPTLGGAAAAAAGMGGAAVAGAFLFNPSEPEAIVQERIRQRREQESAARLARYGEAIDSALKRKREMAQLEAGLDLTDEFFTASSSKTGDPFDTPLKERPPSVAKDKDADRAAKRIAGATAEFQQDLALTLALSQQRLHLAETLGVTSRAYAIEADVMEEVRAAKDRDITVTQALEDQIRKVSAAKIDEAHAIEMMQQLAADKETLRLTEATLEHTRALGAHSVELQAEVALQETLSRWESQGVTIKEELKQKYREITTAIAKTNAALEAERILQQLQQDAAYHEEVAQLAEAYQDNAAALDKELDFLQLRYQLLDIGIDIEGKATEQAKKYREAVEKRDASLKRKDRSDFFKNIRQETLALEGQLSVQGLGLEAREKALRLLELQNQARREGLALGAKELAQLTAEIDQQAALTKAIAAHDTPLRQLAEETAKAAEQFNIYQETGVLAIKSIGDAIEEVVTTGKLNWKELWDSFINEFIRINARQVANELQAILASTLNTRLGESGQVGNGQGNFWSWAASKLGGSITSGSSGGGFGSGVGSGSGGFGGSGGGIDTSYNSAIAGGATEVGGVFAGGGIAGMERRTPVVVVGNRQALPHFQSGGLLGEAPAILHRGEGVFTPGQMRAMASIPQITQALRQATQGGHTPGGMRAENQGNGQVIYNVPVNVQAQDIHSFTNPRSQRQVFAGMSRAINRASKQSNSYEGRR